MNPGMVEPTLSPYIIHIFKPSVCQELLELPPSMGETSKQIVTQNIVMLISVAVSHCALAFRVGFT